MGGCDGEKAQLNNGWISVKDRLPDRGKHKRILVFSLTGNFHVVSPEYNEWCLWETDTGFTGEGIEFTHWMPLPEPPKD